MPRRRASGNGWVEVLIFVQGIEGDSAGCLSYLTL